MATMHRVLITFCFGVQLSSQPVINNFVSEGIVPLWVALPDALASSSTLGCRSFRDRRRKYIIFSSFGLHAQNTLPFMKTFTRLIHSQNTRLEIHGVTHTTL